MPDDPRHTQREREAADALLRVQRDTETIGRSAMSRHTPTAADDDGWIELWGKRIGRGLGAAAVLFFLWQLISILTKAK